LHLTERSVDYKREIHCWNLEFRMPVEAKFSHDTSIVLES
jgi:hypothetical protein